MSSVTFLFNAEACSLEAVERAVRLIRERGASSHQKISTVVAGGGEDLRASARRAIREGTRTVVAAGGDGTVNAVANEVIPAGVRLGILPMGTLNHLARDLRIPLEAAAALETIWTGSVARVDAARVGEWFFLNNSSLGLYPQMVKERVRKQRRGLNRWAAMSLAAVSALAHLPVLTVSIELNGSHLRRKTPFVFVGNNVYEMDAFPLGRRQHLNAGTLCVVVAHASRPAGVVGAALRAVLGRLRPGRDLDLFCAPKLRVHSKSRYLEVALDGEVRHLPTPLEYELLAGTLEVIVPGRAV